MDRPSGPLGAATQSSRPAIDAGAPRPAPLNSVARRLPNNNVRHAASSSSLSTQTSITDAQVIVLAENAMNNARDEHEEITSQAANAEGLTVPGVTIDLSHKEILNLPEEVVDIIKRDLERLALSHNQLFTLPIRFSECTSLRYLNVRSNSFREFPLCLCELKSLEILDLGRNKLKTLPNQLVKLTSLKVLSLQRNRLEALPECVAEMTSLQVMKLDDNPLRYPPKEILVYNTLTSPTGPATENEMDDMAITQRVKQFLKQKASNDRSETESGGEESSEGAETPRPPKRVMSGRFPIKVNGTEVPDLRSPAFAPRPPPIPSRSHYRGLSQQNAALRRPGVMPLTIGSANERVRSNSDALLPNSRDPKDRTTERSRRMGIVSRKAHELGTVDEMKANNRFSHYRGLSHGSAMQDVTSSSIRSPASPADSVSQRVTYVKRLSSLPERKQASLSPDPVIEAAKSILYALFLVHPLLQELLGVIPDPASKRTSLEMVFYNANTHVVALEKAIRDYDTYTEEEEESAPRSNETVHRTCVACVGAYMHVCGSLQRNIQSLFTNRDPRYIRSLLLSVYGGISEIRNASVAFAQARQDRSDNPQSEYEGEESRDSESGQTVSKSNGFGHSTDDDDRDSTKTYISARSQIMGAQPVQRSAFTGPPVEKLTKIRKSTLKAVTRTRTPTSDNNSNGIVPIIEAVTRSRRPTGMGPPRTTRDRSVTPTHERLETYQAPYYRNPELLDENFGNGKASQPGADFTIALNSALANVTPRSGASFMSNTSANIASGDFTADDAQFEKIYLSTRATIDLADQLMPTIRDHFLRAWNSAQTSQSQQLPDYVWNSLITMCDKAGTTGTGLRMRLSSIKLKDPGARTKSFWQLVGDFIQNLTEIMLQVREAKQRTNLLSSDLLQLLKELQVRLKQLSKHIQESPWNGMTTKRVGYSAAASASQVSLPMTPQSAALGPAVQATVPSTPQSAFFGAPRHRFGYERSETSTSMSSSISNSRNGTMTTLNQEPYMRFREDLGYTSSDSNNLGTNVMDPTSVPSPAPFSSFASRSFANKTGVGN